MSNGTETGQHCQAARLELKEIRIRIVFCSVHQFEKKKENKKIKIQFNSISLGNAQMACVLMRIDLIRKTAHILRYMSDLVHSYITFSPKRFSA